MTCRRQRFPGLPTVEARFLEMRDRPPDLWTAYSEAMACATDHTHMLPELAPIVGAGEAALASADAHAAGRSEPPYHDRYHFAEVMLAMGWLMASAREIGLLGHTEAALGVVAMAAHDLGHDGSAGPDGPLEAMAAAQAVELARQSGVCAKDAAMIAYIIEGTAPSTVAENASRSRGLAASGPHGIAGDWLRSLAHEADVMPSLLPVLGPLLADMLAQERRRAGAPEADFVATFAGRVSFLRMHNWFTPAASALGLDSITAIQLATLGFAARQLGDAS